MDYEIVWTEPAVAALDAIVAYIAERSPAAARRIGDAVLGHVEILGAFPSIGPAYPPGSRGRNREISYKGYQIFYRVSEDTKRIEILTIWHGRREEPELPA